MGLANAKISLRSMHLVGGNLRLFPDVSEIQFVARQL